MNWPAKNHELFENMSDSRASSFTNVVIDVPGYLYEWHSPFGSLQDQSILDFGCKTGEVALGLSLFSGATRIVGVDFFDAWSDGEGRMQDSIGLRKH